jgi:hypothetical protein
LFKPSLALHAEILGHQGLRMSHVRKKSDTQRHLCLRSAQCQGDKNRTKEDSHRSILPALDQSARNSGREFAELQELFHESRKFFTASRFVTTLNPLAVNALDGRNLRVAYRLPAHHIRKRRLVHKLGHDISGFEHDPPEPADRLLGAAPVIAH